MATLQFTVVLSRNDLSDSQKQSNGLPSGRSFVVFLTFPKLLPTGECLFSIIAETGAQPDLSLIRDSAAKDRPPNGRRGDLLLF